MGERQEYIVALHKSWKDTQKLQSNYLWEGDKGCWELDKKKAKG